MKALVTIMAVAVGLAVAVQRGVADEKEKEPQPQITCPVMGGKIDKAIYVEKDGRRIYACCKGCVPAIKKDFTKYAADLEKAGVSVEKIQTTCPVMDGRKIDKSLYVDHNGKRIYVCCKGCVQTVKKDPAKYIAELEKQGITLATAQDTNVKKGSVAEEKEVESGHGGYCR